MPSQSTDAVDFILWGPAGPEERAGALMRELAGVLFEHAIIRPGTVRGQAKGNGRARKFTVEQSVQVLAREFELASKYSVPAVYFEHRGLDSSAEFSRRRDDDSSIIGSYSAKLFAESGDDKVAALADTLLSLAKSLRPYVGHANLQSELRVGKDPRGLGEPFCAPQVVDIHWINVYGPKLVDEIGRARVMSAPAHRIEALPDGGVFLVAYPSPFEAASDTSRQRQARILTHLRPELSYEEVVAEGRRRSALLQPPDCHFEEDVADLLQLLLDEAEIPSKHARAKELSEFRSAEVTEWMPAVEAPPSDIEEQANLFSPDIVARCTEQMTEEITKRSKNFKRYDPAFLAQFDHYYWCYSIPEHSTPDKLHGFHTLAAGGYLAELLVRELGGRWVAREDYVETQIIIGDRAWLPFLRARHFLASKQALLEFSLTKFFRSVQREAKNNRP